MDKIEKRAYIKEIIEKGKEIIQKGNREYLDKEIDEKALATLVFTSGTTSKSKIVMLSQYNIARNISDMQTVEDFRSTDINLAFLPYHHTFGSTGQLIMLSSGITTAFPDGLRYIGQNLKEYRVTFFVGVPILIEKIYKKIEEQIAKEKKTALIKIAKVFTNLLLKFGIDVRRKVYKKIIDALGGLRFVISGAAGLDKRVEKGLNELRNINSARIWINRNSTCTLCRKLQI
ncbi:MAG: AMP-binding protein [Clostridia bacterium]|jgi:long-chain acyl-CoA synthetase|nr:AMP-binding protein [Clostridia bacterium]